MYLLSCFSHARLFASPWTIACQAPLSMGFSRQDYWSGLPFPSPGDLPYPGIKPTSLTSPALEGRFFTARTTWEAQCISCSVISDSATPWTIARQAPLSMGILQARILEWVAMPSSRDLPSPGIEPMSLMSPALAGGSLPLAPPGKPEYVPLLWQKCSAH